MYRKTSLLIAALVLFILATGVAFAAPGAPDFSPGVYADGQAWGTKGTADLPAPNGHNDQSYDKIFVFTNGVEGQLPVGEAAPRNPMYNGGRWWAMVATWIDDLPHPKLLLTSYDEVMFHYNLGHIMLEDPGVYFQCPLLPVK